MAWFRKASLTEAKLPPDNIDVVWPRSQNSKYDGLNSSGIGVDRWFETAVNVRDRSDYRPLESGKTYSIIHKAQSCNDCYCHARSKSSIRIPEC